MDTQKQNVAVGVALVGLFLIFGVALVPSPDNSAPDPFIDFDEIEDVATTGDIPSVGGGIIASRTFTGGTHIYAGIIALPTPCYDVETQIAIAESFPEQVTIDIITTAPAATSDQMCAQVVTPTLFTAEFTASEKATVRTLLNGKPISVTLVQELPPLQ